MEKKKEEVVSPLDFFDLDEENQENMKGRNKKEAIGNGAGQGSAKQGRAVFITSTDTNVGKTIATHVLGILLKDRGLDVGVMKPVQCGGDDAQCLVESLGIKDPIEEVNPYFVKEELSPNVAFKRGGIKVDVAKIKDSYNGLKSKHDLLLVEGAGGLLVPITDNYLVADLVVDLDIDLIIVARLGLGTINHTLLTIKQAQSMGIKVSGIIFNEIENKKHGVAEKTNPQIISNIGGVPVLGTIPFLSEADPNIILKKCKPVVSIKSLLRKEGHDRTKQLVHWDKKYLWHPFTQMKDWAREEPLVIDEARGCYLKDTDGRKYLDGVSSLWVNVHGHGKNSINEAVKSQINKLAHSTLLGLSNTPAIELSKKLVEISPRGLEKVFYSDNGSTSVEVAIKMAYQYCQNKGYKNKTSIAHLANSYHGDTLGSVSVGGIDLFHKVYNNLTFKTIQIDFPDCYRAPKGKKYPDYAFECVANMEKVFKESHKSIAALVVEPIVQGAAGMIVWPDGVLKKIEILCHKYNVLLIVDEVATGFGRTGKMFACQHEDVSPDFLCLAKGITGGYLPLAATLTTKKIYDGFLSEYKDKKTFFHGHTFTGNPLCCAAALANLEVFHKERVLHELAPKIKYLNDKLKFFNKLPSVGDVRQKGFMVGIELVKNRNMKVPYHWQDKIGIKVCKEVREHGVILRPLGNVIVIMPPLSISIKELGHILKTTYDAIKKVTIKQSSVPRQPINRSKARSPRIRTINKKTVYKRKE